MVSSQEFGPTGSRRVDASSSERQGTNQFAEDELDDYRLTVHHTDYPACN